MDDKDEPKEVKDTTEKEITTKPATLIDDLTGHSDETGAETDDTGRPVRIEKPV